MIVFYISGDGGLNSFSTGLCNAINQSGHNITALDAKSYFWREKTPEKSAADVAAYIQSRPASRQIILIGYSFGADVLPFIVNRLPENILRRVRSVIMLSPSTTTDFEVKISGMLGFGGKGDWDVAAEIGRLRSQKNVIIAGSDEKSDYANKKNKNYSFQTLPGGHHFGDNPADVAKTIISHF
ncbi:hypothetical protein JMG10_11325 [Nostoc ellipsosporum NOK]|nr:hypothetical protein [Nostoc ellipsosporum NOK]